MAARTLLKPGIVSRTARASCRIAAHIGMTLSAETCDSRAKTERFTE
jgi:hypothetical protein